MRAVIIGTDFMKDTDGFFKALETNTNISLGLQFANNFDSSSFETFVESNSFTEIKLISNKNNTNIINDFTFDYDLDEYLRANENTNKDISFQTYLKNYCSGSNITFENIETEENAITIPFIEDADNKLIIRLSYDTTALIDDTYARDNWEFLKLMYDTDPNSIPKCYINDDELGIDSIGTILRDNDNHPNYCVKKRITPSDNKIYPKLYKISTLEELETLKSSLEVDEYIQEFIYNTDDLLDNRIKSYRSIDLIYGSNLDILNINIVEKTSLLEIIENADFDDNNLIQKWDRLRYLPKFHNNASDFAVKLSADTGTKVILSDNTISTVDILNIGDRIKSVDFDAIDPNYSGSLDDINIDYQNLSTQFNISSSILNVKETFEYSGQMVTITTTEGNIFSDVGHAKIMIKSGSNVTFKNYERLNINDEIVLLDNETNTIVTKSIQTLSYKYEDLTAYSLDFEVLDLFLTLEETEGQSRFGLITHNYNYDCAYGYCNGSDCPYYYPPYLSGLICGGGSPFGSGFPSNYQGVFAENVCWRYYQINGGDICYCNSDPLSPITFHIQSYCNNQKSDITYKENLNLIGKSPLGINIYQFNYKGENGLYEGVIAQELIQTQFEAALSKNEDDLYVVDYNKIDVEFKKIN
jgi:hypothetical protein